MNEEHYLKLKKVREEKGFTQAEIAEYFGLSRQAISQWERGIAYPDIDNLMLLCKLYQVPINNLIPSSEEDNIEEKSVVKEEPSEIKNHTEDEEESEKSKDTDLRSAIEILSILIILALSSQIALLGMIVPIIVALWPRKNKKNEKVIYLVSIIGFVIGTYNTCNILSYYLFVDYGTSKIEAIK